MTYSEFKKQYNTEEQAHIALMKLSEKEIRELISNEDTSSTIKACMFQSWKSRHERADTSQFKDEIKK